MWGICCFDSVRRRAIVLRMLESLIASCGIACSTTPGRTACVAIAGAGAPAGAATGAARRRIHIGTDDPASGAAALNVGEVDVLRLSELSRQGRGLHTVAFDAWRRRGLRRCGR